MEKGQAGVYDGIEVTPAMQEAGVTVLWESGVVEQQLDSDADLVTEIFVAMLRLYPHLRSQLPRHP